MEDGKSDTTASNAPAPALETPAPAALSVSDMSDERNPVFEMLVSGDNDIIGLVAYSIYKQNKRDWLIAFAAARGREPTEDERLSYIIGDITPRRLATFRHLAQATLEGRGPDVPFEPGQRLGPDGVPRHYPIAQRPRLAVLGRDFSANNTRAAFIALSLVALVAIYLAARFGLPGVTH